MMPLRHAHLLQTMRLVLAFYRQQLASATRVPHCSLWWCTNVT